MYISESETRSIYIWVACEAAQEPLLECVLVCLPRSTSHGSWQAPFKAIIASLINTFTLRIKSHLQLGFAPSRSNRSRGDRSRNESKEHIPRSSGEIRRGETLAKFPFQFPIEVSCLRNQSWIGLGRIALGCRVVDQYQSTPCACSSRHFARRRCQKNICWLAYGIWGNGVCIGNWSKCRFITLKLK